MDVSGIITRFVTAPANVDERGVLREIVEGVKGLLIADKGYIDATLKAELAENGLDLQTPLRDNMPDPRPKEIVRMLNKARKPIETALSILVDTFHLTKIKAHDLWHYTNKLTRKILAYNFYIMLKS